MSPSRAPDGLRRRRRYARLAGKTLLALAVVVAWAVMMAITVAFVGLG